MKKIFYCIIMLGSLFSSVSVSAKEKYENTYNMNRAREEFENRNFEGAKEFLKKEIKEHPDNGEAYLMICLINYRDREFDEIFGNVNNAIKHLPKKEKDKISGAYVIRAESKTAVGDTVGGLEDFENALKWNPDNEMIYEARGQLYYELDKYDDSDKDYNTLVLKNPGNTEARVGLGRNASTQGRYDEALAQYDKAVNIDPDYSLAYSYRAETKLKQEKYIDAIDDIIKALEIDRDKKAYSLLFQFPEDKTELITAKLKGGSVRNPFDASWPYFTAQIYMNNGKYKDALKELEKAYEVDAYPTFLEIIAECYTELGDYPSALANINKAIEMDSEDTEFLMTKADILGWAGNVEEAIEEWTKFIEKEPDYGGGYYKRAFLKDNADLTDEALADYEMSLMLMPDFTHSWLGKADMLMRKGEKDKAMEAYRRILELDTVPSENSCAMYAYLALGEKEKGEEFMEKVIASNPDNGGCYYDGACFYSRAGNQEKALVNLRKCLEKGYRKIHHIMSDDDLEELRKTEEFKHLMEEFDVKDQPLDTNKTDESEIIISEMPGDIVEIPFIPESGCASVKCTINDLPLTFIFDTGASLVSMSQLEANFMLKNGYLKSSDFVGKGRFIDANGDVSEGSVINLRNVEFGGLNLSNVKASVVKNQKAPLLLGQTVLGRLGSIEIDNNNKKLIIKK